jgi:hypothetical protein
MLDDVLDIDLLTVHGFPFVLVQKIEMEESTMFVKATLGECSYAVEMYYCLHKK